MLQQLKQDASISQRFSVFPFTSVVLLVNYAGEIVISISVFVYIPIVWNFICISRNSAV